MTILILGGNGYLGSKLAHKLAEKEGYSIVCTQRQNTKNKRLVDIGSGVRIVPTSIDAISTVLQYEKIDAVLNLITEHGVRRFVTIGTSLPSNLNMYSFSKKMLGEFGRYYAEKNDLSFTDIRLEMFYGADEPKDRFIPGLIEKMLLGDPVDVTIGTQKRDIIAVEDVITALEVILNADMPGYCEIPVGTGVSPTISEIVDHIWCETRSRSKVNKGAIPMRLNEPDCVADLSQLRRLCDWQPTYWKTGLSQMIESMKKELLV